jgi:hypothetical protein
LRVDGPDVHPQTASWIEAIHYNEAVGNIHSLVAKVTGLYVGLGERVVFGDIGLNSGQSRTNPFAKPGKRDMW